MANIRTLPSFTPYANSTQDHSIQKHTLVKHNTCKVYALQILSVQLKVKGYFDRIGHSLKF